jgi:hypothetical protein
MGSAQSSVVSLHSLAEISAESLTTYDLRPKTDQGTAKGTGFDRQFQRAQVAQVIVVGYSSMKQEWRSQRVTGFPFWLFWP